MTQKKVDEVIEEVIEVVEVKDEPVKPTNVVVNASKGYNYSYASLGDIAYQGFKLPKMKTGNDNNKEYVYYYDEDLKEWIRGAEIVIPDGRGMNKAQLYGASLSYARRYTTLMAMSLACLDDKTIEELNADGTKKPKVEEPKQETQKPNMSMDLPDDEIQRLRSIMFSNEPKDENTKPHFEVLTKYVPQLKAGEKAYIVKQQKLNGEEDITEEMAKAFLDWKARSGK